MNTVEKDRKSLKPLRIGIGDFNGHHDGEIFVDSLDEVEEAATEWAREKCAWKGNYLLVRLDELDEMFEGAFWRVPEFRGLYDVVDPETGDMIERLLFVVVNEVEDPPCVDGSTSHEVTVQPLRRS